jgi:diguanylate cyclase (GGDEF)-like protein/PAS domain S-box-containing protein
MTDTFDLDVMSIVDNLQDGLYLVDRSRRIIYWNKAAERITGFSAVEVLGRPCADNILIHVDAEGTSLCAGACPLTATMRGEGPQCCSVFLHHSRGHRVPVAVHAMPLLDRQGAMVGAVESFSETSPVDDLRHRVISLERLALIDPLTELPNRRYLQSELEAQLARLRRSGIPCGVILMDIDHFKRFNDEFGHEVGDLALQTVARTCAAVVRQGDLIGRWGGEEFLAVLPNAGRAAIEGIAARLCNLVRQSRVECGTAQRSITVSVGATEGVPTDDAATVVRRADAGMYASKQRGRDCVTFDADPPRPSTEPARPPA